MNILAIGGSNSKKSINRALANYTAKLFDNENVFSLDISQLDIPMYSIDREHELGIPNEVMKIANQIDGTDLIILSLAENNGSFNVGIKNIMDWISRINDRKTFNNKPMLLMATSPGARGGTSVLESAKNLFPFSGAQIVATFSLPEFYKNFDLEKGITNSELLNNLKAIVTQIKTELA